MSDHLQEAASELGLSEAEVLSPVCVAYALMKMGVQADEVAGLLSWREFEQLSGALLRSAGYQVSDNVVLTKPRAQIDIVAYGTSTILSVDCKHWERGHSPSSLRRFAEDQLRRSSILRAKIDDERPILSAILSASEPSGKFVEGVPIVPVRTLRSFLGTMDSYFDSIEFR